MDRTAIAARIAAVLVQDGLSHAFAVLNDGQAEVSCRGVRSELKRADVLLDAGLAGQYAFSILCPASQLALAILEPRRTRVRWGGTVYRLLGTDADALGASFRLHLGGLLQ